MGRGQPRGHRKDPRALWDNLQNRMPDDEGMLIRLRDASELQIYHPPRSQVRRLQNVWVDYMARCRRRHLPWFVVNALLAPISVLLAPFPGPNLIGYWFLYRGCAICWPYSACDTPGIPGPSRLITPSKSPLSPGRAGHSPD